MSDSAAIEVNRNGVGSSEDGVETDTGSGVGKAIWNKVKGIVPDLSKLYLQPLDASTDMSFSDRISLIFKSARPIGDFLDLSKMNLPPVSQIRTRLSHNVETYLYNYFLLGCIHLGVFTLIHFGSVLAVVCWGGLMWFLYVMNKEDIDVGGKFVIDKNGKVVIAATTGLVAVWFGNVWTLVMSMIVFAVIVVGTHGMLRDNTSEEDIDVNVSNIA